MINTQEQNEKSVMSDIKKINYTKEEFDSLLKHNNGFFKNHVDKYESYYNLDRSDLKGFGIGGQYNIPYLTAPLIKIMIENITENPYRDGRLAKVEDRKRKKERHNACSKEKTIKEKKMILEDGRGLSLDKIIKYNELIIKDIENLPIDIKVNLKSNTTYEFNYILNEVMPLILDRISILFSLLISQSSVSAGNSYIYLIDALDSWIRNFIISSIEIKENKYNTYREGKDSIDESKIEENQIILNQTSDGEFNSEVGKSYIIDSILREEYYRNLSLSKEFNHNIKENGLKGFLEYIGYKGDYNNIDKSEISRYKLIEWIDQNYNKKSRQNLTIQENRLLNFKNKVRSIDEIRNGKMMRVDFYKQIMKSIIKSIGEYDSINDKDRLITHASSFIDSTDLGRKMDKYLKKIIRLNSYKQAIYMGTIDIDPNFTKDLELYATKLWEEFDCKDKKKEQEIEKIIQRYYDKLRNEDGQISKIKSHLTKAIEEMMIPTLIDEINNL